MKKQVLFSNSLVKCACGADTASVFTTIEKTFFGKVVSVKVNSICWGCGVDNLISMSVA